MSSAIRRKDQEFELESGNVGKQGGGGLDSIKGKAHS